MELIKFRRQYLITAKEVTELDGWQKETFNGMNVYAEQSLQVHKRNIDDREFLLLGYWINPHSPEMSDDDILTQMVQDCDTFQKVLKFLYPLSGRFALFCRYGESVYGVNDASGYRHIFYSYTNDSVVFTSNVKLINYILMLKEKESLFEYRSTSYYSSVQTYAWPAGYCFFENIYQLIPNHYINVKERKVIRFYPNSELVKLDDREHIDFCIDTVSKLVKSSIDSLCSRTNVSFSLTSGIDSRVLLSLSKENADKMYFWISYLSRKQADYFLPFEILNNVGLKFHPVKSKKQGMKFAKFYDDQIAFGHPIWRDLYGSLVGKYPDNMIVVRGASCETIENYYYMNKVHPEKVSVDYLLSHPNFGYLKDVFEFRECMSFYLEELQDVCNIYKYKILDFVFWEQREGQWQAQSQMESDFLLDVYVPFNNREILDMLMTIPNEFRNKNDSYVFNRIIKLHWPELLNYPFNPPSKYSKFELKMQYYKEAAKFKLKKMFGK